MNRLLIALTLGSLIASTGCAPFRPDAAPGAEGVSQLAVLANDGSGAWTIDLLDRSGEVSRSLEVGNIEPSGFAWHPDGYFLVHDWQNIYRLDMQGNWDRFNNQPVDSGIFRINVTDDGGVTVAAEYDVTEIDPDGDIIAHTQVPSTYCWMDASGTADGGSALLDIFGPNIASWDTETGSFDILASGLPSDLNVLGQDDGGRYWAASTWAGGIQRVAADGTVDTIALGELGAWGVKALESAGPDSVYALYEGDIGNGIATVDGAGQVAEFTAADSSIWLDMITY